MINRSRASGFTIVELLIVIVVIGVLAAITIVAFNGIQQRARVATVKADLSSAAKQLELTNLNDGAYPADTSSLKASAGTTYQYAYTASTNTYCLTATNGTSTYNVSTTATTPTEGGCAGHGVGGVAAVTNLITNPSIETNATGYGNNGTVTVARSSDRGQSGSWSLKITTSGTTNVGTSFSAPVEAGKTYTLSGYVYFPASFGAGMRACAWGAAMTALNCGSHVNTTGGWQRVSHTFQAANTASATLYFYNAGTQPAVGSVAYVDSVMLTESSSALTYADGTSSSWVWNGTAHASTSTGPAL